MSERYVIVVEPVKGETPAIVRLRRAQKALLRWFGLRVVEPPTVVYGSVKIAEPNSTDPCESCTRTMGTPSQEDPCP